MLSKEAIDEFKAIYKKQYGEDLSDFVASEAANRLVNLVSAVYKPIPIEHKEEFERITEEQAKVPESEKKDLAKHLVGVAKSMEFEMELTRGRDKKEANQIRTQLTIYPHNVEVLVGFLNGLLPEDKPKIQIDRAGLPPQKVVELLGEFDSIQASDIQDSVLTAVNGLRFILKELGYWAKTKEKSNSVEFLVK